MSGTAQSELVNDRRRRRLAPIRKMTIVTAMFIVAVIALAGLSISLFGLAQHYHDSKYRAQYQLVSSLLVSVSSAQAAIEDMVDGSVPEYERLGDAVSANRALEEAQHASYAINVMYPGDSHESAAFSAIGISMRQAQIVVSFYDSKLIGALSHNTTYESNDTVNSLFLNITGKMADLNDLVSAGIDNSQDWQRNPYSLVKKMDLASIEDLSKQIEDIGRELATLIY